MKQKIIMAAFILAIALVLLGCELGTTEAASTIPIREPYISVQPQSYAYVIGGDPAYTASPELEIKIYDWDSDYGLLSLQWYTFTDMAQISSPTRLTGETGLTYTPPPLTPEPGKRYYYYVEVTNANDVTDRKVTSIKSELAIISFRNLGDPAFPVIVKQPAGGVYQFGRNIGGIRVEAQAEGGGVLSYQWYQSPTSDVNIETGTPIDGAIHTTFMPDADSLRAGKNYFFVAITNTQSGKTVTELSFPAVIEMTLGERAAAPRIDVQPKDQLAFVDVDTLAPLTITAVSPDSGRISYQWYSNTRSATTGATAISGATSNRYTPVVESGQSVYYYVAVTNTNNNVAGEKTAVINSKVVKVSLQNHGDLTANATINIADPSLPANRFQYIRGYGGMEVLWGNFPNHETADTELMYDPDRLGYNILRIMIPPTSTDMEVNMADALERLNANYYENVKIVNKYGGYVAAAPWSPPKEWKSNNSVNGGGNLIPSYYKLYANYLKNFAQHMYDHGAPIYVVSIQNEPNYVAGYDGCEWTGDEMRDFFIEVGHFTDGVRGYGGGRETPVVLTMNGESANTPNINLPALADPRSNAAIDVLARHIYGEQTTRLWGNPNLNGKEVWMTEHNINSANATGYTLDSTWNYIWRFMNDVDLVIRLNNENAFVWWASKRFYSMVGDGQYDSPLGQALPRGYGLSHYSKFTIDKTRIWWTIGAGSTTAAGAAISHNDRGNSIVNNTGFSLDNLSPRITAFVSEDGNEISLVMWTPTQTSGAGGTDMGTIKINLPEDFTIRSAVAVRSTAPNYSTGENTYMVDEEVTVSQDRKSAYVTLPRSNLLSVKFTR